MALIEANDVIRLMLQFMKENNLVESWKALSAETDVCLNTVDNMASFISDIHNGRWDSVLNQVNNMKIPKEKMFDLYEQVILELLEVSERDLAREMLRATQPMQAMRADEPQRFLKLEHLCKRPFFNMSDAYDMGSSKERRRQEIANSISAEVSVVPPSRLLALLGQSLSQGQANIPKDGSFDVFRWSQKAAKKDSVEKYPTKMGAQIKFSTESHPETATFSPDGQSLVTGSIDGFIEVWNHETCKLRLDLEYQAKDELMMHEKAVLCSAFSKDGDLLATGSQDGQIKVWKLSSGACVRKFPQAHPQGITSLCFARDGSHLLSTSFDHTARIQGLKSGKTLKEFRGHTSYVNCGIFTKEGHSQVLTGSSDGTVKLWDAKTTECLLTFRPGYLPGSTVRETTVHTIQLMPTNPDHIVVCNRSSTAYITTVHGQVVRAYSSGKLTGGDFITATISPQGKWLYCVGEDGVLYVFDVITGQLEHVMTLSEDGQEVLSIVHHPNRNLLATMTDGGHLKLWKS